MKTKTINLYQFSELSEEAKEKAISKLSDINVDFDWWSSVYYDANEVKIKITSFDLDRNRHCEGYFLESATETAELIKVNHGAMCETYKTAVNFLDEWDALVEKYSDGEDINKVSEENEQKFDEESFDIEDDFKKAILEDYSILLQKECEYLTSEKAITETIEANEYDFDEDGNLM